MNVIAMRPDLAQPHVLAPSAPRQHLRPNYLLILALLWSIGVWVIIAERSADLYEIAMLLTGSR